MSYAAVRLLLFLFVGVASGFQEFPGRPEQCLAVCQLDDSSLATPWTSASTQTHHTTSRGQYM